MCCFLFSILMPFETTIRTAETLAILNVFIVTLPHL